VLLVFEKLYRLLTWCFVISCNTAVDHFYRPKLARAIPCSVERIVIRLRPSLDKFEEELSLSVQNEFSRRQTTLAGGAAQVIKRYLQVFAVLRLLLFCYITLSVCFFMAEMIPK